MPDSFPISVEIPVLWGDLDSFGHVNNARYFTWLEAARMAYFARVGLETSGADITVGPILATTTCNFLAPVHHPDTVTVQTRVPRVGNTSFQMDYRVSTPEHAVAEATAIIVVVDYRSSSKIRVPDPVRAAIRALEGR